jgi:hypothetical protein
MWTESVKDMLYDIKSKKIGGDELRSIIKTEMQKLISLRMELFCRYL